MARPTSVSSAATQPRAAPCAKTRAVVDHHAADPGAERVAEVEGRDVEARRQVLVRARSLFEHAQLHRCHGGERGHAEQADEDHRRERRADGELHRTEHHGQRHQRAQHSGHRRAVGELAAQDVADGQSTAEHQQDRRHGRFRQAGDLRQQGLDVGEHHEHAGEAEHRHREAEQNLRPRQHGELFAQRRRFGFALHARHEHRKHGEGKHADQRHGPEGGAPAELQAQPGTGRHAEQRGGGEAGEAGEAEETEEESEETPEEGPEEEGPSAKYNLDEDQTDMIFEAYESEGGLKENKGDKDSMTDFLENIINVVDDLDLIEEIKDLLGRLKAGEFYANVRGEASKIGNKPTIINLLYNINTERGNLGEKLFSTKLSNRQPNPTDYWSSLEDYDTAYAKFLKPRR